MANLEHDSLGSSQVHEPKHITSAGTGDSGKVITPSGTTAGTSELRTLLLSEISTSEGWDALELNERNTDPSDPAEGKAVLWMSDGTGAGDDGDIMLKITAGSVTKTVTLVDFSAA